MTTEPRDIRIKRLKIRAEHRGIKEMDLILGGWAAAHLPTASDAELDLFEAVLAEADHDLYQWVTGQSAVPEAYAAFIGTLAGTVRSGGA
ncbi:FAD assembly factor SdhE [Rhodophyticola porphyridii]|nr:succinate dehydrogenase assembly factor 2 [Rhodophyticola porphyridii]